MAPASKQTHKQTHKQTQPTRPATVLERLSNVSLLRFAPQALIFAALGLIWLLVTNYTGGSFLLPKPSAVGEVLAKDSLSLLVSIGSSAGLLGTALVIALLLGLLIGMACGNNERLKGALLPIARVLAPVPSLIYAPYAVAVMGDFKVTAVFVIALGLFWPVLFNTVIAIEDINPDLTNTVRTLNLSTPSMFLHVMLPHCLPYLFNTLSVQTANAFLLLVGAEMMGMTSGLGWYVKYWADYSNFTKVFAGIAVIAVIAVLANIGLEKLRDKVLAWK